MNLRLSPIKMALEIQGKASLMLSSINVGAMFSPPAVIINSFIRPIKHEFKLYYLFREMNELF